MAFQTLDFTGADGRALSGRLERPAGEAARAALIVHCLTSQAADRLRGALVSRGYAALDVNLSGLDADDVAAAAAAMTAAGLTPGLLVAHSLAAGVCVTAAEQLPDLHALALVNAVCGLEHVAAPLKADVQAIAGRGDEGLVNVGSGDLVLRGPAAADIVAGDHARRLRELARPLLLLHAPLDTVAGIDNATDAFLAARHPKSFVSLDRADHVLSAEDDGGYAGEVIAAWAGRYAPRLVAATERPVSGIVAVETRSGRFQVEIRAPSTTFFADEPVDVGGLGSGPSPYELLSAALGACTTMTLRLYADQKGWPVTRIRTTIDHVKLAGQTPADCFSRLIHIEGPLDDAQIARLFEIADRCPVHRTLEGGARVLTPLPPDPTQMMCSPTEEHYGDMRATVD